MNSHILRTAVKADLEQINAIFNHYVTTSTCVWTSNLFSPKERDEWFLNHDPSLPIMVAEYEGRVVGWGELSWFETACTFTNTVENSVYVHHEFLGKGIGKEILFELVRIAKSRRLVSVIACISSDQTASIALHKSLGFVEAGRLKNVGYKFGNYKDLSYYQLVL